jgi:phage baseplate assembly protein W
VNRPFLGFGLIRPFRRDLKSDFASAGDVALVKSCVAQVLGTEASSGDVQGELPWRPEFGSSLYRLAHRKGPLLNALARTYVTDALARWEPRVRVRSTSTSFDRASRTLTIELVYDIINGNVAGNAVIVSGVAQTVALPLAA